MSARPSVRPGPGSWRLLAWLARIGVAGIEPLALAMGVSERVAYVHVRRLIAAGLVLRPAAGDGEGGVVVLTRAGARVARDRGVVGVVSPRSTAPTSARHGRSVSWVAAAAQGRGWEWLGASELREGPHWRLARDDGARHLPDLGLVIDGRRVAVEVELHAKAPRRVAAILRGYRRLVDAGSLAAVSYVVDRRDVAALIGREARAVRLGSALQVDELAELVDQARRVRRDAVAVERRSAVDECAGPHQEEA